MKFMSNEQTLALAQQLEHLSESELSLPTASLRAFGEVALYANRAGYLRLAAAMLRCASGEQADIGALFAQDSDFAIDHLTLTPQQFDSVSS